jgi:hypothetical protein
MKSDSIDAYTKIDIELLDSYVYFCYGDATLFKLASHSELSLHWIFLIVVNLYVIYALEYGNGFVPRRWVHYMASQLRHGYS